MALVVVALLVSSAIGIFAASQSPAQAHHLRGNSDKVRVHGTRPHALTGLKADGKADGSQVLQLSVALRLPHAAALSSLIAQQQTPASAKYHHYLTPQGFTDQYAPSASDLAAVRAFLQQHGLKVTAIASNRLFVNAEGTVAQVEQAFGVSIGQYQVGKRQVYAPDQDPIIPDTLATIVAGVSGLDNVGMAQPHYAKPDKVKGASNSASTPGASPHVIYPSPIGGYTPTDLRSAYDVSTLISNGGTGASQRVAVFELAPYIPGDIATYRAQYGLPASTINNHQVDGGIVTCTAGASCDNGSGIIEADLDIEVVSALAPNATQDIYTGPNTWPGVNDTYNAIVTQNLAKVVTTSWGLCEPYNSDSELWTLHNIFTQAASQGQTIFAAAGDAGSDDCYDRSNNLPSGLPPSADSPASDPYVMGVGGTSLSLSSGTYGSESEWNSGGGAGGGGISSYFPKPSWQTGTGTTNSYNTWLRGVPDVGANADPVPGYAIYCSSKSAYDCVNLGWFYIGGTSAAAPLWAGITADLNTYLAGHGGPLGWANQTIYTLLANAQTHAPFHDVTSGNNDIDYGGTSYAGSYPSTACYDMNTGVGTPDVWNIAQDVAAGVQQGGGGSCPAPAAGTNLVQDSGFENTPSSWQQFSSNGYPIITPVFPHIGNDSAYLCEYPGCDDRVWQDMTVPATVHSATLTFWEEAYTDLTSISGNQKCLDHFYVTLATPDGSVVSTIPGSCATNSNGYTFHSFDVTSILQAHQGQQLRLMFRGTTANISVLPVNSSTWFVDDVSLVVS
ncbi:MAG: S53 family peptidase [Ktedonobacterales bacterium]